mmetsp:Transcript_78838/g.209332  ORF Transcript_78838/g.209332 Transcript_78838/m.209332 type:complete len:269 (-) Transcript_78838:26-832(-)
MAQKVDSAGGHGAGPELRVEGGRVQAVLLREYEAATCTHFLELIDDWRAGRGQLHVEGLLVGRVLDVLPQCPEGVLMPHYQQSLAGSDQRCDVLPPEGHHAVHAPRQGLAARGQLLAGYVLVQRAHERVPRVVRLDAGGHDVIAAAPEGHVGLPKLGHSLRLREALQGAGVARIQLPSLDHGHGVVAGLLHRELRILHGARKNRGVDCVELPALGLEAEPCFHSLLLALDAQRGVAPASVDVLGVPLALAVAHEDNPVRHYSPRMQSA